MRVIQEPSIGTLVPMPDESVEWDTTQNVIIEGDNLEVLKLLQKAYYGKVKMIYIDPPYNTGKEFIYPDNFREGLADYLRYSGQVDEEGFKLSANAETDGRYHSKWLSMMYPRLFLARNLLREDGVIFVIDRRPRGPQPPRDDERDLRRGELRRDDRLAASLQRDERQRGTFLGGSRLHRCVYARDARRDASSSAAE